MPMKHRTPSKNPAVHRVLTMQPHNHDPQRGADVKELQKACNERIRNLKLPIHRLKVDGECGRATVSTTRRVARHLGVGVRGVGCSEYLQRLVRDPSKRTASQVKRGKKYREDHITPPLEVRGNSVTGGDSNGERVVAAAMQGAHLYYTGQSKRFYSQVGQTTFDKAITGEPEGFRSDCSEFGTGCFKAAGAPDPCEGNYDPGKLHYTGTIWKGGKFVDRTALKPGDLILYGTPSTFHHVEIWVGNGDGKTSYAALAKAGSPYRDRTVGHGSPPVDYGDIDMMAGAHFVSFS